MGTLIAALAVVLLALAVLGIAQAREWQWAQNFPDVRDRRNQTWLGVLALVAGGFYLASDRPERMDSVPDWYPAAWEEAQRCTGIEGGDFADLEFFVDDLPDGVGGHAIGDRVTMDHALMHSWLHVIHELRHILGDTSEHPENVFGPPFGDTGWGDLTWCAVKPDLDPHALTTTR